MSGSRKKLAQSSFLEEDEIRIILSSLIQQIIRRKQQQARSDWMRHGKSFTVFGAHFSGLAHCERACALQWACTPMHAHSSAVRLKAVRLHTSQLHYWAHQTIHPKLFKLFFSCVFLLLTYYVFCLRVVRVTSMFCSDAHYFGHAHRTLHDAFW